MLLLLIFEQAELYVCQNSLLDNLRSQSRDRCSTEAEHTVTHTLLLAFCPLRHQNSKFSGTWGADIGLVTLLSFSMMMYSVCILLSNNIFYFSVLCGVIAPYQGTEMSLSQYSFQGLKIHNIVISQCYPIYDLSCDSPCNISLNQESVYPTRPLPQRLSPT